MSLDALGAARKITGIPSRDKFVLMALADYAHDNQNHTAEIRQSTLAEWTCMSRQTVNAALHALEFTHGLIQSEQLYRDDKGMRSKRYRLLFMAEGVKIFDRGSGGGTPPSDVNQDDTGVSNPPTGGVNAVDSNNRLNNGTKELKEKREAADAAALPPDPISIEDQKGKAPSGPPSAAPLGGSSGARKRKPRISEDPAALARAQRAAEVWNEFRGALPEVIAVNAERVVAVDRKVREVGEERFFELLPHAVANVSRDSWWLGDNAKGSPYGFDNLLAGNHLVAKAESELQRGQSPAAKSPLESAKDWTEGL